MTAFWDHAQPGTRFDLTSVNNTTDGPNGLPIIGSAKAVTLTIVGNGDIINRGGSKAFGLLDVALGAWLTLNQVTLQHGLSAGSWVAINNHGTLMVSNCTVSNISGGGIFNHGGTVTVRNSTLFGNASYEGGGIYNAGGTVTVRNCTLSDNNATYGGGIYNASGTVTVNNSVLSGNSATYGGGIYDAVGTMTVSKSTLSSNYATPDYSGRGGYGGGIYNRGGTVMISNSILSGNSAAVFGLSSGGGGIYNDPHGMVTVQNSSSITRNTSGSAEDVSIEDVLNLGVLYLDSTSTIGILDGNPAIPIYERDLADGIAITAAPAG